MSDRRSTKPAAGDASGQQPLAACRMSLGSPASLRLRRACFRPCCFFLLLIATATAAGEAPSQSATEPLVVRAWVKDGKPREFATRTVKQLADFSPVTVPLDAFGGWQGQRLEATGFFHARKIQDRWWLIDPAGHRFLHVAVNSVSAGDSPQNRRAFPARFGTAERWRDATVALLREHGFNGTGCWSDDALSSQDGRSLVYTPTLRFMSGYGRRRGGTFQEPGHTGYPNRCIFAFDPEFEQYADEIARSLAEKKDDPWLLGYFSDNEMPFPRDSLDRYLQLEAGDPGREAARRWWAERQGDQAGDQPITDADRDAWLGYLADRYFSIVSRAIKRYDPNHLYLGSRFYSSEKNCREVFVAAGRHVDVISVNVYGVWTPTPEMLRKWTEWSGRPILVTEWYAKGQDTGMGNLSGAGWTVATQQERGYFYQNFVLGLLQARNVVGWHWFKYMDNDPEDRRTDPSNRDSNKGIVTTSYEPYAPLLQQMRELNSVVYPLTEYLDR